MKTIIDYLNKDSLFGYFMHNTLKTLILIFISTFLILQFFEPYLLAHMPLCNQLIINIGSSILACFSYAISFLIFAPHSKLRWTKLLELGMFLTCFIIAWFLVSTYLLLLIDVLFPRIENIKFHMIKPDDFFLTLFFYTIGIGLILYIIIHAYDILISHEKFSYQIENNKTKKFKLPKTDFKNTFIIERKNKKENLEILHSQFLYAKSEGHYVKIFFFKENKKDLDQYIIRNTISNLEQQLGKSDIIFRCHKSYLINLRHCQSFIKNPSRNFVNLKFKQKSIPVSLDKVDSLAFRLP